MKRARVVAALGCLAISGLASADEGMWTFNNFPKKLVKQRYKLDVSDAWLEHVRLSAVRFNSGGSGSFVSPRGLVMTNHHVGADCINKLAATNHDYIQDGFYAKSEADEIKCPDLELNVVVGIEDVTADVKSVEKPGMEPGAINAAQKEKMAALEKACTEKNAGQRCDVVTLYQGGVYNLYRYKKYTDVRLAFAPEFQIAFFGGDPDNFEYPRFDLDVAFFRVYEDGAPVKPEHFLTWSAAGAKAGEPVFVAGNPGNTERLDTVAQLETLRDTVYPSLLEEWHRLHDVLTAYGKQGAEEARQARTPLFGIENSLKAVGGYLGGLRDAAAMKKKEKDELALRLKVEKLPNGKELGGAWDAILKSQVAYKSFYPRYLYTEGRRGNSTGSHLFSLARTLLRAGEEKTRPSEKRLREYRDSNLASLELDLFSTAPLYPRMEEAVLASALDRLQKKLGASDPLVKSVLAGKTPAERAHEAVAGTKLADVAYRKQLYADKKALDASKDPMLALARAFDPESRALRKRYEDEVEAVVKQNLTLVGKALFATQGLDHYPDATFTLRLSFGKVAGYTVGGKKIAPFTTIGGLFERADQAKGEAPWNLPKRWLDAKSKLKLSTPMDFVSTNDIIGGNSGSPVVNAKGELVGLIFDGNIQSLPGNFVYDEKLNRAVSVHSSALIEALRAVYDAGPLADELQSKPAPDKKHAER